MSNDDRNIPIQARWKESFVDGIPEDIPRRSNDLLCDFDFLEVATNNTGSVSVLQEPDSRPNTPKR